MPNNVKVFRWQKPLLRHCERSAAIHLGYKEERDWWKKWIAAAMRGCSLWIDLVMPRNDEEDKLVHYYV